MRKGARRQGEETEETETHRRETLESATHASGGRRKGGRRERRPRKATRRRRKRRQTKYINNTNMDLEMRCIRYLQTSHPKGMSPLGEMPFKCATSPITEIPTDLTLKLLA